MTLLDGKRALVTGCNGRLGPIWMQALRDAGAVVHGTDLPDVDITNPDDVNRLVDAYPDVDILVNNAGVDSRPGSCGEDEAAMREVNLGGTDLMIEKFTAHTKVSVVVNIASLYGFVAPDMRYYNHRVDGWEKGSMYGATKAGVIYLTKHWAAYLAPRVRVNALAPGGVVAAQDGLTAQDPEFARKYTARIPMQRMCRPEDLGGPLVFLASDMSSFVTGTTIPIEGGYLCW